MIPSVREPIKFDHALMHPKDANGTAHSVGPNQTAHKAAV